MKRIISAWMMCGLFVAFSTAQDKPEPREGGEKDPPPRRLAEADRGPRGPGGRGGFQFLIRELNLDEEQQAVFDELAAKQLEKQEEARSRWREVREARRAGDNERAEELRRELGPRDGREAGMSEILEAIEPHLRDDQVSRLWELQEDIDRRRGDRERFQWVMAELPEELGLNAVQKAHYDKLLENERRTMRDKMQELRPSMEELREAVAAGDEDRIRELRQIIDDSRPSRTEMIDVVLDRLPDVLTPEQTEILTAMQASWNSTGDKQTDKSNDARHVLSAAKRVRLDRDQKDKYREIEREAIGAYRKLSRKDKEAHAKLADEIKSELAAMMNEEQVKKFEEALQRLDRGRRERNP